MIEEKVKDSTKLRAMETIARAGGDLFHNLIYDDKVIEIMLNPDGKLWIDKLGEPMQHVGELSANRAESIIKTTASYFNRVITHDSPYLECRFPIGENGGGRFSAQIPPIVDNPSFSLRKRAVAVFTLDDYVSNGSMTEPQKEKIIEAINSHRNILVAGGTSSGKTTLLNAVIDEMVKQHPAERLIILEDLPEIQCNAKNSVILETSENLRLGDLLRLVLRMRPDRILVGEVRGAEALNLLEAWNTGHEGGAATVHCNSPEDSIDRLMLMVSKNPEAPRDIEKLIGSVVDIVVYTSRKGGIRKVDEVVEVTYKDGKFNFNSLI